MLIETYDKMQIKNEKEVYCLSQMIKRKPYEINQECMKNIQQTMW